MVLANQGFFTKMWFLERYALAAHPAVVVLLAGALVPHDPFGRFRGISLAGSLAVAANA